MLNDALRGEIAERHAKYLLHRDRLRTAVHACAGAVKALRMKRRPLVPVVALSAVAVPAGLLLLGARNR